MKLLFFVGEHGIHLGIKRPDGVLDVTSTLAQTPSLTPSISSRLDVTTWLFSEGNTALDALESAVSSPAFLAGGVMRAEGELTLAPCVLDPAKIICVGLNYRRHAVESNMAIPSYPVLFSKFNNAIAASYETIPLPSNAENCDYEAELAVIIGRAGRNIPEAEALSYVLGYANANDLSARDLQMRTSQWLLGKTLDKFMPIGPYLVTPSEIPDPQALGIRCSLNGQQRQNSSTGDMIFPVSTLISYISSYIPLKPGDVILTGTPEGVILGMKEKTWLKAGDEVVVEIDGLGSLVTRFV